jgi:hypothetical protein
MEAHQAAGVIGDELCSLVLLRLGSASEPEGLAAQGPIPPWRARGLRPVGNPEDAAPTSSRRPGGRTRGRIHLIDLAAAARGVRVDGGAG